MFFLIVVILCRWQFLFVHIYKYTINEIFFIRTFVHLVDFANLIGHLQYK